MVAILSIVENLKKVKENKPTELTDEMKSNSKLVANRFHITGSSNTFKYKCSVYNNLKERFSEDGCVNSYDLGIMYDPFPGNKHKPIPTKQGLIPVFFEPKECSDGKWRPLGIEECTYTWNKNTEKYEGECEGCGKCCMMGGPNGDQPCKYLIGVEESE